MKRVASYFVAIVILLFAASQFTSCEKYVLPEVSLDPDTLYFDCLGATKSVNLNSNVIWKIKLDGATKESVQLSPASGDESAVIDVTVSENQSNDREFVLIVETETFEKKLTLIQEGKPVSE